MFSGAGAQAALQLIVTIVLARLLTPADFGLMAAASTVIGFLGIFSTLGVGPALVQLAALEERHIRTGFTLSLLLGVLLSGLLWLLAPWIARFFRTEELMPLLRALALIFPIQSGSVVALSLLQRELRFRRLALIDVVSYGVGYGIIGISLACMKWGAWALAGAHAANTVLTAILVLLLHPHAKRFQCDSRALRELTYFGGGLTIARVCGQLALQGDNVVVGRWLGVTALGLYSRAYNLMSLSVVLFGEVLDKVIFPTLTKIQSEPRRLAAAYRRAIASVALLTFPMSIVCYVLAPEIIEVLFGRQWQEAVYPFRILAVGIFFRVSYRISGSVILATGAVYGHAWRHSLYAGLVLIGAWIGQYSGLSGVAVGVVGALAVHFMLMTQLGMSVTTVTWRELLAAHTPALVLGCAAWPAIAMAASLLRSCGMSPVIGLTSSLAATLLWSLMLACCIPKIILGQEGIWLLHALGSYFSGHTALLNRLLPSQLKPKPESL